MECKIIGSAQGGVYRGFAQRKARNLGVFVWVRNEDQSGGRVYTANSFLSKLCGPTLRAKSLNVFSMSMQSASADIENKFLNVAVLYEDENLLAVDKPAGLVVHVDGRTTEPTLTEWVLNNYPALKDVGGMHTLDSERYVERVGILHRLDRGTSGVIVIAKNDETFYFLQRQFLDHSIEKTYVAFVEGVPAPKEGTIDLPVGRSRSDFRQWATGDNARGNLRKACTIYRTISGNEKYSYLELKPKTGRTHQLRVHLKTIGYPIVCDKRYGSVCALGFSRLALHAKTLAFQLPQGEPLVVEAQLPDDFVSALKKLGT